MSYYIIPKVHYSIEISPNAYITKKEISPCISHTFINYFYSKKKDIQLLCNNIENMTFDKIIENVNTHEYIFSKVPGSNYSVSKLKPKSILFYDLFELIQNINLLDTFKCDILNSLIIGNNYEDSLECLEMLRENYTNDKFFCYYEYNTELQNWIKNNRFNFIIYEINNIKHEEDKNINDYIIKMIETIIIIISNLIEGGIVIIKIENLFYKPILDIIYLFTSLFEKTYIIKPTTSCIINFDKYIILKNYIVKNNNHLLINNYNNILKDFLSNCKSDAQLQIKNIINSDLPYYFLNKIDDINLIIGQQQLELMEQIINILLCKNKEDKLENLKKYNIQKCVQWCEKFKIPCNKFSDKINIFLPVKDSTTNIHN